MTYEERVYLIKSELLEIDDFGEDQIVVLTKYIIQTIKASFRGGYSMGWDDAERGDDMDDYNPDAHFKSHGLIPTH